MTFRRIVHMSAVAALGAGLAPGCVTGPRPDPPWVTRVHRSGVIGGLDVSPEIQAPEPVAEPSRGDPGEIVRIGAAATAQLQEFFAAQRTVIGDVTVVDLSRTPFLGMTAFSVSPDDVEREDSADQTSGILTVRLRNRSGVRTVLNALPRAKIGEVLLIGTDQLVLRYHGHTDRERPVQFRAVAEGRALVRSESPPERHRGRRATLRADVVGLGDAARFVQNVEVDP